MMKVWSRHCHYDGDDDVDDDDDDDDKSHDDDLISVWSNHLQSHAWCPLRLESPG